MGGGEVEQEKGEREPKGREDPRTGGQQEDMITKKRRMTRCEDTKGPAQLCCYTCKP
jgi:hypothetical protein